MQFRNFITTPTETSASSDIKAFSYYKQGVRVKFPKKAPPLRMQILPAFNPANPTDDQGCLPCLVSGQPSPWFGMIRTAKFVGHGDWKSTIPILSLTSFEGTAECPYVKLLSYCKNNPDWKYLVTKTGKFGAPDYKDAVLKPVKSVLLLNIVDVDDPGRGVQIAEVPQTVATALLDTETGIVFQRNLQLDNYPNASEALAANPMLAYANGDITNPANAPVFIMELPPVRSGQFGAGYTVRIAVNGGQVMRRQASAVELASRYHLEDPESFMNIPTGQSIVDSLVTVLKGHKNAHGIDEVCAIKEAVGDLYRVDVTPAPGAVSTTGWTTVGHPTPSSDPVVAPVIAPAVVAPAVVTPAPVATPSVQTAPVVAPAVTPAVTIQNAPAGFAPNPAVATPASEAVVTPTVPTQQVTQPIPGEVYPGGDPNLANALAARLRSQLSLRK